MLTTSQTLNDLEISRAYELRPGAVYAIRLDRMVSAEIMELLCEQVREMEEKTGCKFILLEKCFDLVRAPDESD